MGKQYNQRDGEKKVGDFIDSLANQYPYKLSGITKTDLTYTQNKTENFTLQ